MLSSNKIKNYLQKEFWGRLQQLNQATQKTEEEEAELRGHLLKNETRSS